LTNSEERISTDDGPPPLVPDESFPSQSSRSPSGPGAGLGNMAGMADMLRGMGGAGGMPDIMSMMQNPQMMAMVNNMMANGGMESLY
jgi:small glutamine-rich tetratricopeptide repeat-containing protein alpha